jgi:hypothetical protein
VPYNDVGGVFTAGDTPDYVVSAGKTRFVFTRTTIGPDGKAQDCAVERTNGKDQLGAYTCAIILKRARLFEAAKWTDGSPTYGIIRTRLTYAIDALPSNAYPPDMEVSVNRLPAGAKKSVHVELVIAADENGRVVGCRERPAVSPNERAKHYPDLVEVACQQISSQFTAVPAKDRSGKPVRSVQSAYVTFKLSD